MKLTIFTPVYNRRILLENLYQSLEKQTRKDFIWLIVDDGSTDGSSDAIKNLAKLSSFEIQYIYQENRGKHVAHNTGVEACKTDLFICVDSDDTLLPNAVETILNVDSENKGKLLLGYYFRKIDTNGKVSGGEFKVNNRQVGLRDLYHKYGFKGELAIVLKTGMIKGHEFPVFQNEKFVSELVLYNDINNIAPMLWNDEIIYSFEYQENGYSNNAIKLIANNPYGTACGFLSEAEYAYTHLQRAKSYSEYIAITRINSVDAKQMPAYKVSFVDRCLAMCFLPHYFKIFGNIKKKHQ